jgi:hypothetical protein
MSRLVVIALLAACAYGAYRHYTRPADLRVVESAGERSVVTRIDAATLTYSINGPADEIYMVFQGDAGKTSFAHASFHAIEAATIRRIKRRYPDYHRCNSPGAPEAKRAAEHINVVGDKAVLQALGRAVAEAGVREASAGERLCVAVTGSWLTFEQLEKDGIVITGAQYASMIPAFATKQYFLHLVTLQPRDCRDAI